MRRWWVTLIGALAAGLLLASVGLALYGLTLPRPERPYVAVGALFALGSLLAAFWLLSRAALWALRASAMRALSQHQAVAPAGAAADPSPLLELRCCMECGGTFRWRADHQRNQLCHLCRLHERLVEVGAALVEVGAMLRGSEP